ncbi:unnamed protein product [Periconia digitata]|uniref:Uncharacterized protein n=1 Tax=Periconia digitata TaxID=1303443 RepID=A0A9W4UFW1_9PLEO|nr:unnamed protein product [Periconia digitata]
MIRLLDQATSTVATTAWTFIAPSLYDGTPSQKKHPHCNITQDPDLDLHSSFCIATLFSPL